MAFLFFAGSMLLQTAWILALPPFRGIDEFDHAYRAAAVAEGQWKPHYEVAEDGRGWYLVVPRALAEAATPVCESYEYTGPDNCNPVESVNSTHVTIASAAAKYSPGFYWLVGTPSLLFDGGEMKVLSMRMAGAILCSLFVAQIAWMVGRWASTRWPIIALAATLTPVVIYSSSLGAPNGVEMLAGLVVWAALLGIGRTGDERQGRQLVYGSMPALVVLVTSRAIGPLWLLLITLTVVAVFGANQTALIVNRFRRPLVTASAVVTLAVAGAGWWLLNTRVSAEPEGPGNFGYGSLSMHLQSVPLWILQSVGAFPTRGEHALPIVYACALVVISTLLILGMRHTPRRVSIGVAVTSTFAIAISSVFNLITYDSWGQIWQGRYALPYMLGVPLLAAYGLDVQRFKAARELLTIALGASLLAVAHAASVINVLVTERAQSPISETPAWHAPPSWLVLALVIVGVSCWAKACARNPRTRHMLSDRESISNATF